MRRGSRERLGSALEPTQALVVSGSSRADAIPGRFRVVVIDASVQAPHTWNMDNNMVLKRTIPMKPVILVFPHFLRKGNATYNVPSVQEIEIAIADLIGSEQVAAIAYAIATSKTTPDDFKKRPDALELLIYLTPDDHRALTHLGSALNLCDSVAHPMVDESDKLAAGSVLWLVHPEHVTPERRVST